MKNFSQLNAEQICYIKSYIKEEYFRIEFLKEKKFFGITLRKQGFYHSFSLGGREVIAKEEIEKDNRLYYEGENVYYKPHVEIGMSSGQVYTKFFNDKEKLLRFKEGYEMYKIRWINM